MADAAKEETAHCDMDHRLGDVEALFVVTDQASPASHPPESALDDPTPRQNFEARFPIDASNDLDDEVVEGGFVD